jgi:hypothetical protein
MIIQEEVVWGLLSFNDWRLEWQIAETDEFYKIYCVILANFSAVFSHSVCTSEAGVGANDDVLTVLVVIKVQLVLLYMSKHSRCQVLS